MFHVKHTARYYLEDYHATAAMSLILKMQRLAFDKSELALNRSR